MKNLILLPFVMLFLLSNCTETVYEEVVKIDTLWLDRPAQSLAPTFITTTDTIRVTDTVRVEVIIREIDTVYQVITRDSIIIKEVEKVIHHRDTVYITKTDTVTKIIHDTTTLTVYDRTVVYLDSFVVVSYMRPTYSVPDDIQPFIEEFYTLANQYGLTTEGNGVIIVQYVTELPGENWSSNSWTVSENSQNIIELDQRYPAALHRAGIFREMSRLFLNKKYVVDINRIMCPLWNPSREIKKTDLDILFK